jgi:hypothetical protein
MITQVRFGCGPGRTLVPGHCVARTTNRHTRRVVAGAIERTWRAQAPSADRRSANGLRLQSTPDLQGYADDSEPIGQPGEQTSY